MSFMTRSKPVTPVQIVIAPPMLVTVPPNCSHVHTLVCADTPVAYEALIGDEQRWTDHSSHPARVCRQKTVRDQAGNKITVRPPLEGNRL